MYLVFIKNENIEKSFLIKSFDLNNKNEFKSFCYSGGCAQPLTIYAKICLKTTINITINSQFCLKKIKTNKFC